MKSFMQIRLIQEHTKIKQSHTLHEALTWFGQSCLRPRMSKNYSTIQ